MRPLWIREWNLFHYYVCVIHALNSHFITSAVNKYKYTFTSTSAIIILIHFRINRTTSISSSLQHQRHQQYKHLNSVVITICNVICFTGYVYRIGVKTADIARRKWEGTDGEVYVHIHGSRGSSDRLVLQGDFEDGRVDRNDKNKFLLMNLGEVSSTSLSKCGRDGILLTHMFVPPN